MARTYTEINAEQRRFIEAQKVFFVATAARDGRINVSPKGMDTLRVLGPGRVVWLNLTGSGNETAAHVIGDGRMTIMFCAFEGAPLILRLYGRARLCAPEDPRWAELASLFPPLPGARQVFELDVDLVKTSCGYGVPLYDFTGERDELRKWSERLGPDGIKRYWEEKNAASLDGMPTDKKKP